MGEWWKEKTYIVGVEMKVIKRVDTMPYCRMWKEWDICGGDLVKTNWLPSSGGEPVLREYKCSKCGGITYLRTGRLQKVKTKLKDKTEQRTLL